MSDPFKDAMVEETSRNRLAPDSAAPKVELRPFEDRSSFRALMDDLDNITLQAHHNIDKFKLVDQRPITIKIPTNKKIPHPPSPTSNESSPLSSKPEVVKPEVVKPDPSPAQQISHSAPKIIKSSVGRRSVPPESVPVEVSKPVPEIKPKGSAQLEALKNAMREKSPNSPVLSRRLTPEPVKSPEPVRSPLTSPTGPASPVKISSPLPEPGDLTPSPEPLPTKKVEFTPDLGSIEGSTQSVKEWSQSLERKAANSMAEIRKKISKKDKLEDKKVLHEQKEIQVR